MVPMLLDRAEAGIEQLVRGGQAVLGRG